MIMTRSVVSAISADTDHLAAEIRLETPAHTAVGSRIAVRVKRISIFALLLIIYGAVITEKRSMCLTG